MPTALLLSASNGQGDPRVALEVLDLLPGSHVGDDDLVAVEADPDDAELGPPSGSTVAE